MFFQHCFRYVHDPDKKYNEILVPTVDTTRTDWLLRLQTKIKQPVLLVGETGTSKTATVQNFLRTMDKDTTVSFFLVTNLRSWEGSFELVSETVQKWVGYQNCNNLELTSVQTLFKALKYYSSDTNVGVVCNSNISRYCTLPHTLVNHPFLSTTWTNSLSNEPCLLLCMKLNSPQSTGNLCPVRSFCWTWTSQAELTLWTFREI